VSHPSSDEFLIARLFDLSAAERAVLWQRACVDDPALRLRHPELARLFPVGEIAAASAPAGVSLASPPAHAMAGLLESALGASDHEASGVRIGHYKLLQKIGEGGFGAVWMAEQLEPIRRRVALKIVKIGMDTEEVIARFEAERQALALMDHPNIARVFDAGATAAGRPFFVMELVRGIAITRYCDENRLTAEARLRLFVSVCQAVQHAHHKGVIHRDLKPSNILVTLHDGTPVPKVIDFGIAKAIDKQLTEKTLVTQFHAFVGTPAYTSPEQMEMSGLDVDTRSDIYSLGVLLYELLAGRPPFDPDALVKSGLDAMRRTIREVDPPRPSHRLGTLTEVDRTSVAHARGTDAARLSVLLRGDVDWIVMHCLEKDRTRRYETADALARDVERHLTNEPVIARPPSVVYRAQKLFRRHKLAVVAGAAIAISLVGGLAFSTAFLIRERSARKRAVVAEASENKLRQQAEAARADEAVRAGRASLALAERFLAEDRTAEGLAHLVRAARSDTTNSGVGPRLIAALVYRSFAEPIGTPLENSGSIWWTFYTHGGRRAVSRTDGRVQTWDLATGRRLQAIELGDGSADDLSPDRERLAVGGVDGDVDIWDLQTGRRVLGPLHLEQRVRSVRFSPDGRHLATGGDDRVARIWDIASGKLERAWTLEFPVNAVIFAPDGQRILTTTLRGPPRVWRLSDGAPITPFLPLTGGSNTGGAFSPDGSLIAVTDQRGAQFFDAATGAILGERLTHGGPCYALQFTRDGKKAVTNSDDGTVCVWEVPSGKRLLPPFVHDGRVHHLLHLATDERYLLGIDSTGMARLWDLTTGQLALEPIRAGDVTEGDVAPDNAEFMTGGRDGKVRRWRLWPGAATPFAVPGEPNRIGVHYDAWTENEAWAVYPDRAQKIDLLTGAALGAPRLFPTSIRRVRFAPDGRHLAVMRNSAEFEIWDLRETGIRRHSLGQFPIELAEFSADSSHVAIADQTNIVRVWNTDTGAPALDPIKDASRMFAFSPDGRRLAVAMAENTVEIWNLATRLRAPEVLRLRFGIASVQFSLDGRLIATASQDNTVQLWDAITLRPAGPPLLLRPLVRGAVFSRDSRRLLTWSSQDARVWDVATRQPVTEPMVGGNDIFRAVFSDDGTRVATWSRTDFKVRLWGAVSGQLLAEPVQISDISSAFGFTPSGRFFRTTGPGGAWIWPVPPQSLHNPVPNWLLRLATAVAGGEIDAHAVFHETPVDGQDFAAIRSELAALPAIDPYVEWGRWFLADRTTRPVAPGLPLTAPRTAARGNAGAPDGVAR
jgi:WD40 repeat protein/serine/threonine protein kinase